MLLSIDVFRLTSEGQTLAKQLYNKHKEELKWPSNVRNYFASEATSSTRNTIAPSAIVQSLLGTNSPSRAVDPHSIGTTLTRSDSLTQRHFIEEVVLLLDSREIKNKADR